MLLAEVALLLDTSFLGDSGRRLSTRSLVSFLALVGSYLVGLCVGLFLCTYVLYLLIVKVPIQRHYRHLTLKL